MIKILKSSISDTIHITNISLTIYIIHSYFPLEVQEKKILKSSIDFNMRPDINFQYILDYMLNSRSKFIIKILKLSISDK